MGAGWVSCLILSSWKTQNKKKRKKTTVLAEENPVQSLQVLHHDSYFNSAVITASFPTPCSTWELNYSVWVCAKSPFKCSRDYTSHVHTWRGLISNPSWIALFASLEQPLLLNIPVLLTYLNYQLSPDGPWESTESCCSGEEPPQGVEEVCHKLEQDLKWPDTVCPREASLCKPQGCVTRTRKQTSSPGEKNSADPTRCTLLHTRPGLLPAGITKTNQPLTMEMTALVQSHCSSLHELDLLLEWTCCFNAILYTQCWSTHDATDNISSASMWTPELRPRAKLIQTVQTWTYCHCNAAKAIRTKMVPKIYRRHLIVDQL